jgi:hypothetical protein
MFVRIKLIFVRLIKMLAASKCWQQVNTGSKCIKTATQQKDNRKEIKKETIMIGRLRYRRIKV